jgi:hypothetical protein
MWYNAGDSSLSDYKGFEIELDMRHVKTPEIDSIVIDYFLTTGDWLFLRNGKMIINIDGVENITLEPHESQTEVGFGWRRAIVEIGFYSISKADFLKVCEAKEVSVRISGSNSYHEINNNPGQKNVQQGILPGDKFLFMLRAFHMGLMQDDKYNEWISGLVPAGTENAPAPKSGCFIATAAMGDYDHPVVVDLRFFRDNWLLKRDWGVKFTKWYYQKGPIAANVIEKSTLLKKLTFVLIVKPLQVLTNKFFN